MLWQENWWEVVSTFLGVSRLRCIVASGYGCRFFLGMRFPVIPVKTWVLQFNCLVHSVYMRQCQLIVFRSVNSVSNGMAFEWGSAVVNVQTLCGVALVNVLHGTSECFSVFSTDPWFHLDWKREKNLSWEKPFSPVVISCEGGCIFSRFEYFLKSWYRLFSPQVVGGNGCLFLIEVKLELLN